MRSRREILQFMAVSAGVFSAFPNFAAAVARQQLTQDDLLSFDAIGQVTLLHLTDIHGQLNPVYFRPPSENFGVANFEGIPPHLVGQDFLHHFFVAHPTAPALFWCCSKTLFFLGGPNISTKSMAWHAIGRRR